MKTLSTVLLAALLIGCGSTNKIKASGGVTTNASVEAKLIVEYPQSERCFTSPLIDTYEKLIECLKLTTNQDFTISVDGDLTKISDAVKGAEDAIQE